MPISKDGVVVNLEESDRKWIIGGLFRESASAIGLRPHWHFFASGFSDYLSNPRIILRRSNYSVRNHLHIWGNLRTFLAHESFKHAQIRRSRVFVTHLSDSTQSLCNEEIDALKQMERIYVQNKTVKSKIINSGIDSALISLAPGAINRKHFHPQIPGEAYQVTEPFVLISGKMKTRKNPELLIHTISTMKKTKFILHCDFQEQIVARDFQELPNVTIIPFEEIRQRQLMREASVYLNLSTNEGGPIGLLESLASGTPVVSTDVGFANEYVDESNGVIVPINAEIDLIIAAISNGFELKERVKEYDLLNGRLSWEELGKIFYR